MTPSPKPFKATNMPPFAARKYRLSPDASAKNFADGEAFLREKTTAF
jgi:hypothetical protein